MLACAGWPQILSVSVKITSNKPRTVPASSNPLTVWRIKVLFKSLTDFEGAGARPAVAAALCDHPYFVMRVFRVSRSGEWRASHGFTFEVYKIVTGGVRNCLARYYGCSGQWASWAFLNLGVCHRLLSVWGCDSRAGMLQCLLRAIRTSGGQEGGASGPAENWVTRTLTRRRGCRWTQDIVCKISSCTPHPS